VIWLVASTRASLAASTVLVISLIAVPAATATEPAPAEPVKAAAPADAVPTCAVGAEAVDAGAAIAAATPFPEPVIDCFATFGEAIGFITGGEVAADSPAELDRLAATGGPDLVAAASVILGYEYKNTGYSGGALVLYGASGSGCGSSTTYGFSSMPSGWNNVISSARSFAGCWSTHYDLTNYGGTRRTCQGACSTLGTMNNRTSSIVFRPVGTYG
jgi:hypothetical protein